MEELIARAASAIAAHSAWAGPIVGFIALAESLAVIGVLVPGTAILLAVGGLAGSGLVEPVPVLAGTFLGALAGNWISYRIGRRIGPRAYRTWPLSKSRRSVARARLFFRRFGFAAVLLSRFLGPLRAIVPLVAGVMEMDRRHFHAANFVSAVIWAPAILAPGYFAAGTLGADPHLGGDHLLAFAAGIGVITIAGSWVASKVLNASPRP
jgi:membrane protein DedA with SNARE-associated domain